MMTGDEQVIMALFEKRNVFLKKNSLEGDAKILDCRKLSKRSKIDKTLWVLSRLAL
jgi:hypothetical protein